MLENKSKIGIQPMWGVGCLEWLQALSRNGIVPGIVFTENPDHNHFLTDREWDDFFSDTQDIIIATNNINFRNIKFHSFLTRYKPKYVEIYNNGDPKHLGIGYHDMDKFLFDVLFPRIKCKVYIKSINTKAGNTVDLQGYILDKVQGVNVKNNNAAGATSDQTLEESIVWAKKNFNLPVLASGGIGNKNDIDAAFGYGADAVLIGTLFAVAKESNLSKESKQILIAKNSSDLEREQINYSNLLSIGTRLENDDKNLSKNLMSNVKEGKDGILYAGKAIDNIHAENDIKTIVSALLQQ